jgi:hypothetical protein
MKTGLNTKRIRHSIVGLLALFLCVIGQGSAQALASDVAKTASPELTDQLTKALSITPAQASGGAGALFGLAKSRLSPADFNKVAATVPGIQTLIKSAPAASKNSATSGLSGLGSSVPGDLGGLVSLAGPFKKLGLSPEMAAKFVPVITKFVESKGGAGVAELLAGALK